MQMKFGCVSKLVFRAIARAAHQRDALNLAEFSKSFVVVKVYFAMREIRCDQLEIAFLAREFWWRLW